MIIDENTYLDEEVDIVIPFERPKIRFSHIEANDEGLRPYQSEMKRDVYAMWDRIDNVMLQMPTGTGKTIVFTSIVKDIRRWCIKNSPNSKILIVAHRKELIDQASGKLGKLLHGIIQSGKPMHLERPIQVASIQTFMSRRNYEDMRLLQFDFIIIDEAHHSMASGYQKLWEMFPHSKKLGVTATPWRMSHSGFTTLFGDIVLSKNIEWFVNNGYLANYDYVSIKRTSELQHTVNGIDRYGVDGDYLESELSAIFDKDHIRAQLYQSYEKYAKGKKGIIYAIDRKHARHLTELYASKGVSVRMIDGETSKVERESVISDFKLGVIEIIVNVNIFSEGFDCPDIEFIQLARPTKSLAMYLQQVGRGLRISEGKERTIILDNVGLYNRFGTPMANRKWRYHFLGTGMPEELNDGTGIKRDIEFDPVYNDEMYEEGNEEMVVVEHADGNQQLRSSESENAACLAQYNVFRQNGKYGVCDKRNRVIVPPIYEDMHPYCNGYIPFKQNGKWGIMLGNGTIKIGAKYHYIGPFVDGVAEVINMEGGTPYKINDRLFRI